jgi:protein TonB
MGREGRVVVRVLVDENGRVVDAVAEQGDRSNVGFGAAALEAARKASFRPALKEGVPARMWLELPVDFRLK